MDVMKIMKAVEVVSVCVIAAWMAVIFLAEVDVRTIARRWRGRIHVGDYVTDRVGMEGVVTSLHDGEVCVTGMSEGSVRTYCVRGSLRYGPKCPLKLIAHGGMVYDEASGDTSAA